MEGIELGWIDIAMLALVALSMLAGLVRGFTFEVFSLAGWFVAWFAALWLGPWLAEWFPFGDTGSGLNQGVAYACAFFGVLVLSGIAARAISRLIGATPLKPLDRLLGAGFGVARAALVLLVVVTLVQFSPLAQSRAWQASRGAVAVDAMLALLLPYVAPEPAQATDAQRV